MAKSRNDWKGVGLMEMFYILIMVATWAGIFVKIHWIVCRFKECILLYVPYNSIQVILKRKGKCATKLRVNRVKWPRLGWSLITPHQTVWQFQEGATKPTVNISYWSWKGKAAGGHMFTSWRNLSNPRRRAWERR